MTTSLKNGPPFLLERKNKMYIFPTEEQINHLHNTVLLEGGAKGVRLINGVSTILGTCQMASDYQKLTVGETAILLMEKIVSGHIFTDGNKRTGGACFLLFLSLNGWEFCGNVEDIAKYIVNQSKGVKISDTLSEKCQISTLTQILFKYDKGEWTP